MQRWWTIFVVVTLLLLIAARIALAVTVLQPGQSYSFCNGSTMSIGACSPSPPPPPSGPPIPMSGTGPFALTCLNSLGIGISETFTFTCPTPTPAPSATATPAPTPTAAPTPTPVPISTPTPVTPNFTTAYPSSIKMLGGVWTVTPDGKVALNGTPDPTTANVVKLASANGLLWQENNSGNWYSTSSTSVPAQWTGPITTSPIPVADK